MAVGFCVLADVAIGEEQAADAEGAPGVACSEEVL
jgi:hypothetical protein